MMMLIMLHTNGHTRLAFAMMLRDTLNYTCTIKMSIKSLRSYTPTHHHFWFRRPCCNNANLCRPWWMHPAQRTNQWKSTATTQDTTDVPSTYRCRRSDLLVLISQRTHTHPELGENVVLYDGNTFCSSAQMAGGMSCTACVRNSM